MTFEQNSPAGDTVGDPEEGFLRYNSSGKNQGQNIAQ